MTYNLASNQIDQVNRILDQINHEPKVMVDMTLGNGNDSFRLLKKFPKAKLYGFDIQEIAIDKTSERLTSIDQSRYTLINDSHENVKSYIDQADLFIYNLGYLPGGDKAIKTDKETTLNSLLSSLDLLTINGLIILVFYLGHSGGKEEYRLAKSLIEKLDQKKYTAFEISFLNQINNPPRLVAIERKK